MSQITLSKNAAVVLEKRYLAKDENGRGIETPDDLFRRVARNIASAENLYKSGVNAKKLEDDFFDVMANLEFLPNSPTLTNAGRRLQQLSACFVLPVDDSLDSIFDAVKETAIIHQSGGGTGFSFSRLRPKDDVVKSTGGAASGPVSFMRVFNMATEVIKQGGTRRGANMGILKIDHPDIQEFIIVKDDPSEFTNFNLSVAVTDAFMDALERDADYPLINPRTKEIVSYKKAKEIFDLIASSAWKGGEPGVVFMDRINKANPTPHICEIEATNPCGEQPLLPYESCNLGSINMAKMVKKGSRSQGVKGSSENIGSPLEPSNPRTLEPFQYEIDWDKLEKTIRLGVRFLDNVIDVNKYPLPQIEAITKGNRKIGLGIMGFADMLVRLRIPYDSEEALKIAEKIMSFINKTAWEASQELAEQRGAFPNIKGSVFDKPDIKPVRNATTTTIAPTGTLSIIANCSSGIEPIYSLSYTREILEGQKLPELHPLLQEVAKEEGFFSNDLMDYISKGGNIDVRKDVPAHIKNVFKTAFQIPVETHIKMQAVFQKHTDNAVSKTINLPNDAKPDDVQNAFLLAYKLGCKGVTVYRSGTREKQVLTCKETLYC